jgi:predicted unusual protein kinase regulating ubiquinone biosynthesis (AarF/ABC1/UbiB family)
MLSFMVVDDAVDTPYKGIYQTAFARLQDDAPPMPPEMAIATITAELGRSPGELFAEFDPTPLAAASIGQVHAGTLRDGRRVAVKVQYPGVEEAIHADLRNTELLATFLRMLFTVAPVLSKADIRDMAREISDRIGEEIDYYAEAAHQQRFVDLYRGHPFIHIPDVLPAYSSRRVLTTGLSDGIRYAKARAAEQSLRDAWGEAIFRFQWANLLLSGLFNADPHPGNYLFHPDGSVTFLDFGCVKRFTADQTARTAEFAEAIAEQDAPRLLRAFLALGLADPADPPDADDLLAFYAETVKPYLAEEPFTYTPEYAAAALRHASALRSPHGRAFRKMGGTGGGDFTFVGRIETGMMGVLAGLRATGPWRAIRAEYSRGGPPATPYGEADAAFRKARR